MNNRKLFNLLFLIFGVLVFFAFSSGIQTEAKAKNITFKYKNYNEKSGYIKYSGPKLKFYVNDEAVDLDLEPAIYYAEANTSMAPASVLFGEYMCASVKYSSKNKKLTVTLGENCVELYMGSTTAYVNGAEKNCGTAPFRIKYKASKLIDTIVPARFVAEALGCTYKYTSANTTIKINAPFKLSIEDEIVYNNNSRGYIRFNGVDLDTSDKPSYIILDNALLCLEALKDADPMLLIEEDKYSGAVTLSRGELTLTMKVGDRRMYLNGMAVQSPVAPLNIYSYRTERAYTYIPGNFVFDMLKYSYTWKESDRMSIIASTGETGVNVPDTSIVRVIGPSHDEEYYFNLKWNPSARFTQQLAIPFPEDFTPSWAYITNHYYDNSVQIDLDGDFRDFYEKCYIKNSGEAVEQICISYDDYEDVTRIMLYNRSNEDAVIICYDLSFTDDSLIFNLDQPKNLYDKIVILDAGHGGKDPGTVNAGINEKDVNFNITNKYGLEFFDEAYEETGIKAFSTRYDDSLIDLYYRADFPTRMQADLFISVHQNYVSNKSVNGTEVFSSVKNKSVYGYGLDSTIMSQIFMNELTKTLGTKSSTIKKQNFVVIRDTKVPAVLLEICYMSNKENRNMMKKAKNQKKAAECIFNTVCRIYDRFSSEDYIDDGLWPDGTDTTEEELPASDGQPVIDEPVTEDIPEPDSETAEPAPIILLP